MKPLRNLLLASVALSCLALPAASAGDARTILLAQAASETLVEEAIPDPVLLAEQAVEEARAALRSAMASGRGIALARQNLREAIKILEETRTAAGLPPDPEGEGNDDTMPPPPPPVDGLPPPDSQETPPVAEEPPAVVDEPAAVVIEPSPPSAPEELPPLVGGSDAPLLEPSQPPATQDLPVAPIEPPPPQAIEPPAPTVEVPPGDVPPAETAPPPVVDLPPPVVVEPPPPPPPAAEGAFDLENFEERPNFGAELPSAEATPALPAAADSVREGQTLAAPDGRVIVKNQGQVTIVHDDTGRFIRRGDSARTEQSANQTETTTVARPDGTEIVTVRDRWGNIVQRYRKNPNGSVEVLIGEAEQPGFVGRIFGQGAQPAPPPPPQPPAPLNLQFGPLVLGIPQQQYIVESSQADQQQLQQALVAPPVEQVERAYSLEEIRRSGRLRDKVRRIDFDTITFDTNQATIPDSQIAQMQSIGLTLRDIIAQDPTQVFLVEGHSDAVGADLYNLALSDRRAETVAQILSYYFGIPPENLVTQGYGEQFLKIPTVAPERQNRRVAFRNITYLLRAGG